MSEYDVHFSLNGFIRITADTEDEAETIAEDILNKQVLQVEQILRTGIGVEIFEIRVEDREVS